MKILILEDNPARIRIFEEMFQDISPLITEDVPFCIDNLKDGKWDILFLDHDLKGTQNVPSGPGTGYEVASFLAENPTFAPHFTVVHSHNMNYPNPKEVWVSCFTD